MQGTVLSLKKYAIPLDIESGKSNDNDDTKLLLLDKGFEFQSSDVHFPPETIRTDLNRLK